MRRRKLVRNILIKLKKKRFKLDPDKILDKYNHYTPINHVVDDFLSIPQNLARVKKELKKEEVQEGDVISEYFRNPKIGALHNSLISLERILKLRKKIGGQIILCHPAKHSYIKEDFLEKLKKLGINGVETLSPHHSLNAVMYIQFLARKFDFIETGGSDFHRTEGGTYRLQKSWDYFKIDSVYLRKIKKIIG
jgi:predicted metal-dependent phosphoesterase TrpH